ncbi:MAG: DUF4931 domain-containing protein [Sulfurospirillum sp.]
MSDIRVDLLHNRYVLIAPERLHRPDFFQQTPSNVDADDCPFCEGNENLTPDEIYAIRDNQPNDKEWKTRVVPNLYKAVQVELQSSSQMQGIFETIEGVGAHEVLIDSPNHDKDTVTLDIPHIELWLNTMVRRIEDLKKDVRLIHLSLFKNYGENSGATQKHPHTQLLALPVMPKDELDFLKRNFEYYKKHGRGQVEDIIENEKNSQRVIEKSDNFIAYCPFASSFPFEVIIAPLKNLTSVESCNQKDISSLSHIIKSVFEKLHKQLGKFSYNLYFRLPPLNKNFENEEYLPFIEKNFRFSVRIVPRIYRLGGFEISTNMTINPIAPEECARVLNSKEQQ